VGRLQPVPSQLVGIIAESSICFLLEELVEVCPVVFHGRLNNASVWYQHVPNVRQFVLS